MYILGISCFFHDAAAALLADGQLVAAAEEERFTRKKHDFSFPVRAIDYCLRQAGIGGSDLDQVAFFEKPFLKFERILTGSLETFPGSRRVFQEAMLTWLNDKLWIKSRIARHLGVPESKVVFSDHHTSHAASAFLCSPFKDAAILTVDGVGEWATAALGERHGNDLKLLEEIRFPHSLGLLYSAFTAFLGFEVNEGEYKVMGMAAFGKPRYVDKVRKLIRCFNDGSFELDLDYFSFHRSLTDTFNARFVDLFGPPRRPECPFFLRNACASSHHDQRSNHSDQQALRNQYYADVAASIQEVTEQVLLAMARHLRRRVSLPRLCMAGGVALNSVANARIVREAGFDELFVQPSAGDGGGALGAALWAYHVVNGRPRKFHMDHAYWGEAYSEAQVHEFLAGQAVPFREVSNEDELFDTVADAVTSGKVVGWMQNRFEWGPRALGNRSILADPRREEMKDIVNTKVKFREPFRPFAPAVLAEDATSYFDDLASRQPASGFMLLVAEVRPEARKRVPATTHVDGTGRLQTVSRTSNALFHGLITRFKAATGVPVLLNTSFNLRREPIVNTPGEALSTFHRSSMDMVVIGNHVVSREKTA